MDRRVTPPKRVTSLIWGPHSPRKQALSHNLRVDSFQGSKLTLANSQNASDFDNLRVRKISTSKRLRVRIIHVSQTKGNNLLVVSPVCQRKKILLAKLCKCTKKITSSPAFAAVAFPCWNFFCCCFSALKRQQIPTGKDDVHVRMLQMNSLGLLAPLIPIWLFPLFHFPKTTSLQLHQLYLTESTLIFSMVSTVSSAA